MSEQTKPETLNIGGYKVSADQRMGENVLVMQNGSETKCIFTDVKSVQQLIDKLSQIKKWMCEK